MLAVKGMNVYYHTVISAECHHHAAVNPGHWTVDMRTDALEPAKLDSPTLKVYPTPSCPSCALSTHDDRL